MLALKQSKLSQESPRAIFKCIYNVSDSIFWMVIQYPDAFSGAACENATAG